MPFNSFHYKSKKKISVNTTSNQIWGTLLYANGTKSGDGWQVSNNAQLSNDDPEIAILDNKDLAIVWFEGQTSYMRAKIY